MVWISIESDEQKALNECHDCTTANQILNQAFDQIVSPENVKFCHILQA